MKKYEVGDKITFYWHGELYEGIVNKVRFGVYSIKDSKPYDQEQTK